MSEILQLKIKLIGITGTPGMFVNGKLVKGAVPYATFMKAIDEALSK